MVISRGFRKGHLTRILFIYLLTIMLTMKLLSGTFQNTGTKMMETISQKSFFKGSSSLFQMDPVGTTYETNTEEPIVGHFALKTRNDRQNNTNSEKFNEKRNQTNTSNDLNLRGSKDFLMHLVMLKILMNRSETNNSVIPRIEDKRGSKKLPEHIRPIEIISTNLLTDFLETYTKLCVRNEVNVKSEGSLPLCSCVPSSLGKYSTYRTSLIPINSMLSTFLLFSIRKLSQPRRSHVHGLHANTNAYALRFNI